MRIAVDAMGGDAAPQVVVEGALAFAAQSPVEVLLVGQEEAILPLLNARGSVPSSIHVHHAPQIVEMGEHPSVAVRQKSASSIALGLKLVKDGEAEAFVSAGNTGAVMAFSLHLVGRLPGVERPALGAVFSAQDRPCLLIDAGANADCKPSYLLQFAGMGSAYMRGTFGIDEPLVGLLNIGGEEGKGNQLAQASYKLLQESGLPFVGNIEGQEFSHGRAQVVVTDGFSGNVALKIAEGTAAVLQSSLREALTAKLHYKLAAAILRPAFRAAARRLDYAEYGGAPLLGVNGIVIIGHGRSTPRAIQQAIVAAKNAVEGNVVERIRAFTANAAAPTEAE